MDIIKSTKRVSNFLLVEGIFFAAIVIVSALLFVFLVEPSRDWEALGAGLFWGAVTMGCLGIFSFLALANFIRALFISHEISKSLKQNVFIDLNQLNKFRLRYWLLIIINAIVICSTFTFLFPSWFLTHTSIGKKQLDIERIESRINEAEQAKDFSKQRLNSEPELIKWRLNNFQAIIHVYRQDIFTGFGSVSNNGDCVNPKLGSIFNMGSQFKPKNIINLESFERILNGTMDYTLLLSGNEWKNGSNNLKDARCFSNQDHFAYQLPSYYEQEYPKFYCIDDINTDIQVTNKPIIGPSCDTTDLNYIPPEVKPVPDTKY